MLNNNNNDFRRSLFNDNTAIINKADINEIVINTPPNLPAESITDEQIISVSAGKITGQLNISTLIADNGLSGTKIINDGISSTKIISLTAGKITGQINNNQIEDNSINTNKILNGAITSLKIAANAITNDKILNGGVNNDKISNVHYGKIINNGYVGYGRFFYWDLNNDPQIETLGRYIAKNNDQYNKLCANMVDFNSIANYDPGTDSYSVDGTFFNQAFFWHTVSFRGSDGSFNVGKIYNDLFNENSINANVLSDNTINENKIISLPFSKVTGSINNLQIPLNEISLNK